MKRKGVNLTTLELVLIIVISMILGTGLTTLALKKGNTIQLTKIDSGLQTIVDTYNNIINNYYTDVDNEDVINGAVKGMLDAVGDPYTTYMDENTYNNFNILMEGSYEGLGVEISKVDDQIVIVGIFNDSPAKNAGLELGDIILSIDDKKSSDMTTQEFSSYVRNSDASSFTIKVKRNNDEKTYIINRNKVVLKSVTSKLIEENGKKIGYIYMSVFASNTYEQFNEELISLEKQGIDSLIVDLRDNSGGELTTASNIISLFLNSDKIMYQMESKDGKVEKTYSYGKADKTYKIVVLINENSASAAEVMTAALKENLSATVIGKTSYGKGTVQTVLNLPTGEQYKITTKKWLTPKGNWINEVGIKPDIEVDFTEDDAQLAKAIEYLSVN